MESSKDDIFGMLGIFIIQLNIYSKFTQQFVAYLLEQVTNLVHPSSELMATFSECGLTLWQWINSVLVHREECY